MKNVLLLVCLIWGIVGIKSWGETNEVGLVAMLKEPESLGAMHLESNGAVVDYVINNPTSQPITLLTWGTPLEEEGMLTKIFQVTNAATGQEVRYKGVFARRIVTDGDLMLNNLRTLQPGETVQGSVDLSPYFDFTSEQQEGIDLFHIALDTFVTFFVGTIDDAREVGLFAAPSNTFSSYFSMSPLSSDAVELPIHVTKRNHTDVHSLAARPQKLGMYYTQCSQDKISRFPYIENNALAQVNVAINYLSYRRCDSTFVTWFGVFDQSRWNLVLGNFQKFKQRLEQKSYNYVCNDKPNDQFRTCARGGAAAYMYQDFSFNPNIEMNICDSFWTQTEDFKAGTLYHELSHHQCCGRTSDHCYFDACRNLARTNPNNAVNSAGCYDAFGKSNPRC